MTGNRYSCLCVFGVFTFRVTVEFTSYRQKDEQEFAVFKIVEPKEGTVQNHRIFIRRDLEQNLDYIFREAFDILARHSTQHYKKRSDQFRETVGEIPESKPMKGEEVEPQTSAKLSPEEQWITEGFLSKENTPPSEHWLWDDDIRWHINKFTMPEEEQEKWKEVMMRCRQRKS